MGCLTEDEVKDAEEICGCGLAKELCCWDELSAKALMQFEELVNESEPPTHWKSYFGTTDEWIDWLTGQ